MIADCWQKRSPASLKKNAPAEVAQPLDPPDSLFFKAGGAISSKADIFHRNRLSWLIRDALG